MKLGPILTKSAAAIIPDAHALYGNPIDEKLDVNFQDFGFWLSNDAIPAHVPGGDGDSLRLLKDTPDLLAYCIDLDDLYPMTAVTPGWFVGEAAYQAVRDEVRLRLGLKPYEADDYSGEDC